MKNLKLKNNRKYSIKRKEVIEVINRVYKEEGLGYLLYEYPLIIEFGKSPTTNTLDWNRKNSPIEICHLAGNKKTWKKTLVHELYHWMDFKAHGKWDTRQYIKHINGPLHKYFSNFHEFSAEDLAIRLFGDQDDKVRWSKIKNEVRKKPKLYN